MLSLYATAAVRPRVREVGITNTTVSPLSVALVRLTTATGAGAGLVETGEDDPIQVAVATILAGHTADGGIGGTVRQASIGAAVGAGVIWTFGGNGLEIPSSTGDGVGIITPVGTGQICDCYFVWDE
jgi:hypothetical protein